MKLVFAGQSLGQRGNQEDGFRVEWQNDSDPSSDVLMILADGMGGHEAGEVASAVAIDAFLQHFLSGSDSPRPRERLNAALHRANAAIAERVAQAPELAGMGCTLVGCLKLADRLVWVSVGDSILCLFRRGELRRLNADHSVYGELRELVAQGKLSQADADRHPRPNALRSAVAGGEMPLIDLDHFPLETGDIVLLASDGLETLSEAAVEEAIRERSDADPEEIGTALLTAVELCARPNQDNTTVLVLRHDAAAAGAAEGVSKWMLPPGPTAVTAAARPAMTRVRSPIIAGGLLIVLSGFLLLWVLRPDGTQVDASPETTQAARRGEEQDVIDAARDERGGAQLTPEVQAAHEASGPGRAAGAEAAAPTPESDAATGAGEEAVETEDAAAETGPDAGEADPQAEGAGELPEAGATANEGAAAPEARAPTEPAPPGAGERDAGSDAQAPPDAPSALPE